MLSYRVYESSVYNAGLDVKMDGKNSQRRMVIGLLDKVLLAAVNFIKFHGVPSRCRNLTPGGFSVNLHLFYQMP